jgi:hypothetical protein
MKGLFINVIQEITGLDTDAIKNWECLQTEGGRRIWHEPHELEKRAVCLIETWRTGIFFPMRGDKHFIINFSLLNRIGRILLA